MPAKGTRATGGAATPKNQATSADAARIQSTQAKAGNDSSKGSFPSRVQGAAQRNANAAAGSAPKAPKSSK